MRNTVVILLLIVMTLVNTTVFASAVPDKNCDTTTLQSFENHNKHSPMQMQCDSTADCEMAFAHCHSASTSAAISFTTLTTGINKKDTSIFHLIHPRVTVGYFSLHNPPPIS